MDRTQFLAQSLRQAGLRLTPQRLAICRYLAATNAHPTAQLIYDQLRQEFPSLSLATVYNTLETLVELGAVNTLGSAGDGAEHYDADTSPHVNLACIACHRVIDLSSEHIHALDEEVAARSGYRLLGTRVLYYGLCPRCQSLESHPNE
jgi:Fur family peroxide stress response transcriptional regulator